MALEWVRRYCMALPHVTEQVQWGADLVFKVGGKMFAVIVLEPGHPVCMSFKTSPEEFTELTDRPGVVPAPYLARAHWVALELPDALPRGEVLRLLKQSYELVVSRLPATIRTELAKPVRAKRPATKNPVKKKLAARKRRAE
jgi:predicted DNA-binding protein (MmcQ/YjbR family)